MKEQQDFEKSLVDYLSKNDVSEDLLKQSSSLIVEMRKNNIMTEKIWWYGQPPIDMLVAGARVNINDFGKIKDFITNPLVKGLEIFPHGIPFPEFFDLRFRMGNTFESVNHR